MLPCCWLSPAWPRSRPRIRPRFWERDALPGALDAFLRVGGADPNLAFIGLGVDAGLNFSGLLPGRPADVLGLGVIYARVSPDYARTQLDAPRWGYEAVLEATYKLVITPAWNFHHGVQVIIHPGWSSATPTATVLGIRLDLVF